MKIYNVKKNKIIRQNLRNNVLMPERILWKYLKNKQFGFKFRRQHGIGKYVVDFYCPELKLIVEVDGRVHDEIIEKDIVRKNYFVAIRLFVKVYTARQVNKELDFVLNDLWDFCDKWQTTPNPTSPPLGKGRK
ncbi:MAG: DUF559 domain-containing protein [bacterium]